MIIETLVDKITSSYSTKELADICIVVPNNRAKLYIRKKLIEKINNYVVLPQLLSIQNFMEITASLVDKISIADNLTLILKLFQVHQEIYKDKFVDGDPSFQSFLSIAYTILKDFNDLDLYLADIDRSFKYVNEEKTVSMWGVEIKDLSKAESTYLKYFSLLKDYYTKFNEVLLKEHIGYNGQVYRIVAENIQSISNNLEWSKVFFVGFSALTNSEIVVFDYLYKNNKAEFIWDVDSYYISQLQKEENIQEAGIFLRRYYYNKTRNLDYISPKFKSINFDGWKDTFPKKIPNNFLEKPKTINVISSPGNIQQAQIVGEILKNNKYEEDDTAIVLADENLLQPILAYIPNNYESFNVTMGVPIYGNNVASLAENFIMLFDGYVTRNCALYNTTYLLNIFLNPIFKSLFDVDTSNELQKTLIDNIQYEQISLKTFNKLFNDLNFLNETQKELFNKLFLDNYNQKDNSTLNSIIVIDNLIDILNNFVNNKANDRKFFIDVEVAISFIKALNSTKNKISEFAFLNNVNNLLLVYQYILKQISVSFIGEPLAGLQVLGILETRLLSFKNLIIVSVNEEMLPKVTYNNTFLPYELSMAIGMPGRKEKEGIFAYHFYRLLQNAENINLIYNAAIGTIGINEKSRFILQIQNEISKHKNNITLNNEDNPKNKFDFFNKVSDLTTLSENEIEDKIGINVTPELRNVIDKFYESFKLSASSFNTYLRCQAMFFYNYILKLGDPFQEKENTSLLMGSITHEVLETLYRSLSDKDKQEELNIKLTSKKLDSFNDDLIKKLIIQKFEEHSTEASVGLNILMNKLILEYVHKMINTDKAFIKSKDQDGNLNTLEVKYLEKLLCIEPTLEGKKYKIKGYLDRVDRVNGKLTIMDYKTSSFDPRLTEINAEEFFDNLNNEIIDLDYFAFTDSADNKQYIVQLLNYAYLYFKDNNSLSKSKKDKNIKLGIYALRHHDNSVDNKITNSEKIIKKLYLTKKDNDNPNLTTDLITEKDVDLFEKLLIKFLTNLKTQTIYQYTNVSKICEFCEFNKICQGSKV